MQFPSFYEIIMDLLQGIKTNVLTFSLIYVYNISTVMCSGVTALKSATGLLLLNSFLYGGS